MAERTIFTGFLEHPIATDNMPVTCDVWNSAHNYHRSSLQRHLQASHGWGIVTGLQVLADEKDGSKIYITPGMAIDRYGNMIALPQRAANEPSAYEFACEQWTGLLFVVLRYIPSHPEERGEKHLYRKEFYALEVIDDLFTNECKKYRDRYVELARICRPTANAIITAVDPAAPKLDEIDLRYRRTLQFLDPTPLIIGLVSEGTQISAEAIQGWRNLASEVRQITGLNVHVESQASLDETIFGTDTLNRKYALLVLYEQPKATELPAMCDYIRAGGTVFFDASGALQLDKFRHFLQGHQVHFRNAIAVPELVTARHIFARPPDGTSQSSTLKYEVGAGLGAGRVILNNYMHAPLWAGGQAAAPLPRSTIREAVEWGANVLTYVYQQMINQPL